MKHVDIRYHFVKDQVNRHGIDVKYIRTDENEADVFTKEIRRPTLERLINSWFHRQDESRRTREYVEL